MCLASLSPAKDPTSAKFFMNGIRDGKKPILHFILILLKMFQMKGVEFTGFFTNVKKTAELVFWASLNQSLSLQIKLRKSFVKHMSGRHTNINHFLNGVHNLDSGQSDKYCEWEVDVEFGLKRRM